MAKSKQGPADREISNEISYYFVRFEWRTKRRNALHLSSDAAIRLASNTFPFFLLKSVNFSAVFLTLEKCIQKSFYFWQHRFAPEINNAFHEPRKDTALPLPLGERSEAA